MQVENINFTYQSWWEKHITYSPRTKRYTAWDETGADPVDEYDKYEDAVIGIIIYSKRLKGESL